MIAHMWHSRFVLWYKYDLDVHVLVVVNTSITCIKNIPGAESLVSILMQIYMLNRIMYSRTQNQQYSYMCR